MDQATCVLRCEILYLLLLFYTDVANFLPRLPYIRGRKYSNAPALSEKLCFEHGAWYFANSKHRLVQTG